MIHQAQQRDWNVWLEVQAPALSAFIHKGRLPRQCHQSLAEASADTSRLPSFTVCCCPSTHEKQPLAALFSHAIVLHLFCALSKRNIRASTVPSPHMSFLSLSVASSSILSRYLTSTFLGCLLSHLREAKLSTPVSRSAFAAE